MAEPRRERPPHLIEERGVKKARKRIAKMDRLNNADGEMLRTFDDYVRENELV